jgi:Fic family protein
MQVVSGAIGRPKIHFEAPPSSVIPGEMARFIEWFARSGPGGSQPLPAVTRAGIAHLYFESIHPFEDGNGRIGRAIAEKALAQNVGQPTLIVLAATILARRTSYYAALEVANGSNEITGGLPGLLELRLKRSDVPWRLSIFLSTRRSCLIVCRGSSTNGRARLCCACSGKGRRA